MASRRNALGLLFSGLTLMSLATLAATSTANAALPSSGTIKVDGESCDGGGNNEPHDTCAIEMEFTGFDASVTSRTVIFSQQGGNPMLQIPVASGDPVVPLTNGAGSETYTLNLAGFTPHPSQGYHVHISATTSEGTKTKVIWLLFCPPQSPSPSASASASVSQSASASPSTSASPSDSASPSVSVSVSASASPSTSTSAEPSVSASATTSASPSPSATVLGVKITNPGLATTGAPLGLLFGAGLGLALAGAVLLAANRRGAATER